MAGVLLRVGGGFVACLEPQVKPARRVLDGAAAAALEGIRERYLALLGRDGAQAQLLALGRELAVWLDGPERWLGALRQVRPLVLELRGPAEPGEAEWAVLQAPWELIADEDGFFAADGQLTFSPIRRLGEPQNAPALSDHRLGLTFMAGAPRGEVELAYEAEESAILGAAGTLGLDLVVEESGNPELLAQRLGRLADMPVLHLSCHGHNAWRPPDQPGAHPRPVLFLEDDEGNALPTDTTALVEALGVHTPRLLALSACLTAAAAPDDPATGKVADSLATALVGAGVPAVLGWEGSIYDHEATAFAHELYEQLANGQPLERAASVARRTVLTDPKRPARHWHLARLWFGPQGGGKLIQGGGGVERFAVQTGYSEFLDAKGQRSPVAGRDAFIGRRREMQAGLRSLRGTQHAGLLGSVPN